LQQKVEDDRQRLVSIFSGQTGEKVAKVRRHGFQTHGVGGEQKTRI
jgi:hypothetical protein